MREDFCELRMQQDFFGVEKEVVELKLSRNTSDEIELSLTALYPHGQAEFEKEYPDVKAKEERPIWFSINKGEAKMIISYIQNHFNL